MCFLTNQAVRSLDGLTAFSALPDAPVLPSKAPAGARFSPASPTCGSVAPGPPAGWHPPHRAQRVRLTPRPPPPLGAVIWGILEDVGRVTLQTVADKVGVSRMTVSNAFSRPDQLSDELRKKILAAAEELGYWGPDPSGRALARGRSGAVGVMLTDSLQHAFTDQFATVLMAAIAGELAPTGLALTLLTAVNPGEALAARDVALDGAMVFSCSDSLVSVDWLRRRRLPMVFIDQEPHPDDTCVNIDEAGGARAAVEHLVGLGHTRIAVLTAHHGEPMGPLPIPTLEHATYTTRTRTMAYVDALVEHGIEPIVVNAGRTNADAGAAASEALLSGAERPTALLCFADVIAAGRTPHRAKARASMCPAICRSSATTTPRSRPRARRR